MKGEPFYVLNYDIERICIREKIDIQVHFVN